MAGSPDACMHRSTIRARMIGHGRTGRQQPPHPGTMPSTPRRLGSQYISGWPENYADACAPVTRPGGCSLAFQAVPLLLMNLSRCHSTERSLEPETAAKEPRVPRLLVTAVLDCCGCSSCARGASLLESNSDLPHPPSV
jgi:hypothetical protein